MKQGSALFEQQNALPTKQPVIVLKIDGLTQQFSTVPTFTSVKYGDPGVTYGAGYVYGGLRQLPYSQVAPLIDRAGSNSTVSSKLEQWDGRSSIEVMSLKLVDKDEIMTQVISPGVLLPEILNARCWVYFGYQNTSYPEDYIVIFYGYVNQYVAGQGFVTLQFTDPSAKRKQTLFNPTQPFLTTDVAVTDTTINLTSTAGLYQPTADATGVYDPTVTLGIVIDNEIITYGNSPLNVTPTTLTGVTRGAFGTTASTHSNGTQVNGFIDITDNPVNIALKVMLSNQGPYATGLSLRGINNEDNGSIVQGTITFPPGVDVVRDYGVTIGTYAVLSNSPNSNNNRWWQVTGFDQNNRTILVTNPSFTLVTESAPTGGYLNTVCAFQSKYDTLPLGASINLGQYDVDVSTHEYLRDTFLQFDFVMQISQVESSGKDWIEEHLMKPIGAYTLVLGSKISMGLTHPPLSSEALTIIDPTNVVNAKDIQVTRGLNTRYFYNEVQFNYDYDPVQNQFNRLLYFEDADAQQRLGQVSTLSIDVRGMGNLDDPHNAISAGQAEQILNERAERILLRYRYAAETVDLTTNFTVGNIIDSGDVVILNDSDPPVLQISDTQSGVRGIIGRPMEVQERQIDISNGKTKLTLLSNLGFYATDRYALIGPSSQLTSVDTISAILSPSFGAKFGFTEYEKWTNFAGFKIRIHDATFTNSFSTTFEFDPANPNKVNFGAALPFSPTGLTLYMELDCYDESSASSQALAKSTFAYVNKTATVLSGSTNLVFTLQSGQGANYRPGSVIYIESPDASTRVSGELKIISIVGDIVTVGPITTGIPPLNLGFTPLAGDLMKLGGFLDGGNSYRMI